MRYIGSLLVGVVATGGCASIIGVDDVVRGFDKPSSVITADLNGDHHVDLVVADQGSNYVSVLLGYGDGTFEPPRSVFVPGDANSVTGQVAGVTAADFDGDGNVDLAAARSGSTGVMLGLGDAEFARAVTFNFADQQIEAGQLNNDTFPDLVMCGGCAIGIGDGAGNFTIIHPATPNANAHRTRVADVDEDGLADIVSYEYRGEPGYAAVIPQTATGFGAIIEATLSGAVAGVDVGDVDHDGDLDLVAVTNAGKISVVRNGGGTLVQETPIPISRGDNASTRGLVTADFNGDGWIDAAFADASGPVAIALGTGSATPFMQGTEIADAPNVDQLVAADLDEDGHPDLVVMRPGANELRVFRGDGQGGFSRIEDYLR